MRRTDHVCCDDDLRLKLIPKRGEDVARVGAEGIEPVEALDGGEDVGGYLVWGRRRQEREDDVSDSVPTLAYSPSAAPAGG